MLISYYAIFVFLVQKFSCPVATHWYEPSLYLIFLYLYISAKKAIDSYKDKFHNIVVLIEIIHLLCIFV